MAARVPTVLVRGAISDLVDEPIATKMKERAPELTVVSVPDVGHTPTLVEPEAWDAFVAWAKRLAKMS
jgi:pimeloyl-ACP methyl ester carboxylesterase